MSAISLERLGNVTVRSWAGGDQSVPGLLFLHGFERHPGEASFLQRLAQRHRVIAPEHPGYGESTGLEDMDSILDLVLHYREFVESRFHGPVDVVGHSLGGMFAAEFAAVCPQLTRSLCLIAPFGIWLDDQPAPDPFMLNDQELKAAKWADPERRGQPEPSLPAPGAGDANAAIYDRARNLGAATKFMWPIPDHGLRKRLPLIRARTLILRGSDDPLVPSAYAEEFARLIPHARLETIEPAAHMVMFEQEDAFCALLERFLAG